MRRDLRQSVRKQIWGIIGSGLVLAAIGIDWYITGSPFIDSTVGLALGVAAVGALLIHWRKRYVRRVTADKETMREE